MRLLKYVSDEEIFLFYSISHSPMRICVWDTETTGFSTK